MEEQFASRVRADVRRALEEDVGAGDLTAALVPARQPAHATIVCREDAVICGRPWVMETLRQAAPGATVRWHVDEGGRCRAGQVVAEIDGNARALLTAERTCLNFLQTLSAVATSTARHVQAVAGTAARILDTRKTIPGLRAAQKYAVRCGGGHNHRMGLHDAILIKENHISAAGGLAAAYAAALRHADRASFIQVEVETLAQLAEALQTGVTMVLLDNMPLEQIRQAVRMAAGRCSLEVSGGVTLERLPELAATGVDRISVGALIKDIRAVDLSMRFDAAPA
ncbi:MAG: carboxylating nicotinate-nucleotide diphosphorylase [Janthinobacterium lividum]